MNSAVLLAITLFKTYRFCVCIILHFCNNHTVTRLNRFKASYRKCVNEVFQFCKIGQHDRNIGFFAFPRFLYSFAQCMCKIVCSLMSYGTVALVIQFTFSCSFFLIILCSYNYLWADSNKILMMTISLYHRFRNNIRLYFRY